MKQKEYFILSINEGRKNYVGSKLECSFWYTQQPENDVSIEPVVDEFTGDIEIAVYVDGGFACSFVVENLNQFYQKFFDTYISKHEHVMPESGLNIAIQDTELKQAIRHDKVLQKLNKAFYKRLKKITESYGYIVGESESESA